MNDLSINTASLKKCWFGYRTADFRSAESAILVHYDADKAPITAHIYETGETVTGSLDKVLAAIGRAQRAVHEKMTGRAAPSDMKRGFFTQSWQGETRATASGELFLVPRNQQ